MNQSHWRDGLETVTRPGGGERIGYLRRIDESQWEPLNLLGISLGASGSRNEAIQSIHADGLASVDQVWWVRAPTPMVVSRLDARSVDETTDWRRMVVVELTPDRALLRSEIPWPEESSKLVSVDLPAADVLRADDPDGVLEDM